MACKLHLKNRNISIELWRWTVKEKKVYLVSFFLDFPIYYWNFYIIFSDLLVSLGVLMKSINYHLIIQFYRVTTCVSIPTVLFLLFIFVAVIVLVFSFPLSIFLFFVSTSLAFSTRLFPISPTFSHFSSSPVPSTSSLWNIIIAVFLYLCSFLFLGCSTTSGGVIIRIFILTILTGDCFAPFTGCVFFSTFAFCFFVL